MENCLSTGYDFGGALFFVMCFVNLLLDQRCKSVVDIQVNVPLGIVLLALSVHVL